MWTIKASRTYQQFQPIGSKVHGISKVSQQEESKHIEDHVQSPLVPPYPIVVNHGKFQKFIPSMENLVSLLDTYTYDSKPKKESQ